MIEVKTSFPTEMPSTRTIRITPLNKQMVTELELAIARLPRVQSKAAWARPQWICIWQQVASYPDTPTQDDRNSMDWWI